LILSSAQLWVRSIMVTKFTIAQRH
jgi:hypothetical protein